MRNGYLPFVNQEYADINGTIDRNNYTPKIQFFISPVKNFNDEEIKSLEEYIKNGGIVLWSAGFEEKEGSKEVLDKFGFDFDNIPLGPIPKTETICMSDTSIHPQFYKAWPIIIRNISPVCPLDTICIGYNYPVIISKTIGKGKFILISDPGFLLSENIETENRFSEENIMFLKKLFEINGNVTTHPGGNIFSIDSHNFKERTP